MDNSTITFDEIIVSYNEKTKANFKEEKAACKTQNFCILLSFLLITMALLITISIYCYLVKYRAKQKNLLPFHDTKLKQVYVDKMNWKWVIKSKIYSTYYFFNDIIDIENFDPNNDQKDVKSYKNILIYYLGLVAIKYVKIYSANPLHLIFRNEN